MTSQLDSSATSSLSPRFQAHGLHGKRMHTHRPKPREFRTRSGKLKVGQRIAGGVMVQNPGYKPLR